MRAVFFALLAACALPLFAAERVITPDWSLASSLTAMGFPPLAMGDKRIYPVWMSDPVQPPSVVQFADARQLRIFAPNSLFRVAFALMGLEQADLGAGNRWGSRLIALPELAQLPEDTCLIIVGPFPQMTEAELARSYLWRRIGFGRERCLRKVPAVWLFGGPESVEPFGRYLRGAMTGDDAAPLHRLHTP